MLSTLNTVMKLKKAFTLQPVAIFQMLALMMRIPVGTGKTHRSMVAPSLRYGQKPNYLLPLKERSKFRTANGSARKKQKKKGR